MVELAIYRLKLLKVNVLVSYMGVEHWGSLGNEARGWRTCEQPWKRSSWVAHMHATLETKLVGGAHACNLGNEGA